MPRHIWLTLWGLSLLLVVLSHVAMYRAAVDRLHHTSLACLTELDESLNGALHFAHNASLKMIPKLQKTGGDLEPIRDVLFTQLYQGKELVRFAWLDAQDQLRVSSLTGIMHRAVDLSNRDYVKQARRDPELPIISRLVKHAFRHKPVLVVATGVPDDKGGYLGTLNATLNFDPLKNHIHSSMEFCPVDYRVQAPHGEVVASRAAHHLSQRDDAMRLGTKGQQFVISGATNRREILELRAVMVARACLVMVVISGVIGLLYWLVHYRLVRPMQTALDSIDRLVHSDAGGVSVRLNHRLEAMQRLVNLFETMQAQMDESRRHLALAKQHLAVMNQQQAQFFEATSTELIRAYDTITAYSAYLEDRILMQSLSPDIRYDFDDVSEMGISLRQISDDYARLCYLSPAREQNHQAQLTGSRPSSVSLSQSVEQVIAHYELIVERRNLQIKNRLHEDDTPDIMRVNEWTVAAFQVLLLLLIQHARDEATIEIAAYQSPDAWHVSLALSAFRQSMLPVKQQDFGEFIPSMQRDVKQSIEDYISRHAFVLIAQSYLAIASKTLRLEVDENGQVRVVICQL